jgi:hypothetical protein
VLDYFTLVELVELDCKLSQLIEGELSKQKLLGGCAFLEEGQKELWDSLLDCEFAHELAALAEGVAL